MQYIESPPLLELYAFQLTFAIKTTNKLFILSLSLSLSRLCVVSMGIKPVLQRIVFQLQSSIIFQIFFFVIGLTLGFLTCLYLRSFSVSILSPISSSLANGTSKYNSVSLKNQEFLTHNMSDQELFQKALLMVPQKGLPGRLVPKVAFMFLTKGPLPLTLLWEKFFKGHEGFYSIYVHSHPSFNDSDPEDSIFYGRRIPSQVIRCFFNLIKIVS